MEFELTYEDVSVNFSGNMEESSFEKAGFEAAIMTLGENFDGWETYDVSSKENMYPLIRYNVDLIDRNNDVIENIVIDIQMDEEIISIWNNVKSL